MARSQTDIRSLRPKQTLGNSFCGKLQSILFWLEAVLNKQSKRLAYIEDEIEMIDLVRLILGRQGFTVLGANGGREGLDLVRKELPDLVLLDLMMPDMDGWDVYHQIKSEELTRDIPVIVITAKAQDIDKILGLRIAKVEDYISKPFNPQDLVERVEQVLFRGKDTVHQGN
jgi:two-component system response regulator VicR